ncbi:gastrin/cholecystokinin type B receptor-like [Tropilaelaps mercedesae]|uniref:Gastrin/cholecystokinin type B receptor-like n=1 Tax=Tropilaelaps mercedesae TaxID=418985 RepID=A0A1V9WZE4_9ACAR|nr:gastrin/cholecystokinin type B receptor-like [Tropilaelaps mercedesae]
MTETPDFVGEIETTLEEDDVIFLEDMSIYRYSLWLSVLLVGGYASVFIIGLVGNLCVIVVVHRSPRMRSATNHLIVNLAVVDIVVLLVCVPSNLLSNMIHRKSFRAYTSQIYRIQGSAFY